jgi:hypothetical protein
MMVVGYLPRIVAVVAVLAVGIVAAMHADAVASTFAEWIGTIVDAVLDAIANHLSSW